MMIILVFWYLFRGFNYEFKILVYIFKNSDFLITDIKTQLNISSFNAISKYIKNLLKEKYIIRESKHIKNQKMSVNILII